MASVLETHNSLSFYAGSNVTCVIITYVSSSFSTPHMLQSHCFLKIHVYIGCILLENLSSEFKIIEKN